MADPTPAPNAAATSPGTGTADEHAADELVETDLLVEDVSIDGMCGVY